MGNLTIQLKATYANRTQRTLCFVPVMQSFTFRNVPERLAGQFQVGDIVRAEIQTPDFLPVSEQYAAERLELPPAEEPVLRYVPFNETCGRVVSGQLGSLGYLQTGTLTEQQCRWIIQQYAAGRFLRVKDCLWEYQLEWMENAAKEFYTSNPCA